MTIGIIGLNSVDLYDCFIFLFLGITMEKILSGFHMILITERVNKCCG